MKPSPKLALLASLLSEKKSLFLEKVDDAPLAFLIAFLHKTLQKPILLLSKGIHEDRLFEDISFFSTSTPLELPQWDVLPGSGITPSLDLVGKRLETILALSQASSPPIVVASLEAALQKVPKKLVIEKEFGDWHVGKHLPFLSLPSLLEKKGFTRKSVVTEKGEFAVRGGILDLFPIASSTPYRIDFFGDSIESIRTFDPKIQTTTGKVSSFFFCPAEELSLSKTESVSLGHYLLDAIVVWQDIEAIEDAHAHLAKMLQNPHFVPPSLLFSSFSSHIFCANTPLQVLFEESQNTVELLHLSFPVLEPSHPFRPLPLPPYPTTLSYTLVARTQEEEDAMVPHFSTFSLQRGTLSQGFVLADTQEAWVSSTDFSHKAPVRRQKWRSSSHSAPLESYELTPGDVVVHLHSGIGRYLGIESHENHQGIPSEFLVLEYANNSKLFVPATQSHLLSRYVGAGQSAAPTFSELGTNRWQKTKEKAQAQIVGYAKELLELQAERIAKKGFAFPSDSPEMIAFEQAFPYQETEDQLRAIAEIKGDMENDKPMDRLLCGDVGYGKTEVAMRAAYKAVVQGKKQVALLVPTTVLALQHLETFRERMEHTSIRIETLSSLSSPKKTRETLTLVREGKIDILIGTHRLLRPDIEFANLGLLLIDEEQRFGVKAKEHLKKAKTSIDCLSLSATPIPRTLYLSLVHARDLSTIQTPPQDRLPIKTILSEYNDTLIVDALLREKGRAGQSFYIYNRVESMPQKLQELQKLLPTLTIAPLHGQMPPEQIETTLHRFQEGKIDLLLATTLIENGINFQNANTLIVEAAHTYGLSDLYQLKGRIGRWNRPAFAYFLTPKHGRMTQDALKRLQALVEAGGYGNGMKIAMRDLEIRGAGNFLGEEQSGHVSSVGFHLYCKLLQKAVRALQNQESLSFGIETKIEFPYPAFFPHTYIDEPSLRLNLYQRLGDTSTEEELLSLFREIEDRFGPPPTEALWLYHMTKIRLHAQAKKVLTLQIFPKSVRIEQYLGKKKEIFHYPLPPGTDASPQKLSAYLLQKALS